MQVCVISGESGAGKTESAKQFVRQIMDVSARGALGGDAAEAEHVRAKHPVETKIIQQNPILEAFGNAKTVMNDNSSRFGKFIDLKFGPQGTVTGADMSHYLLEKARIVMQGLSAFRFCLGARQTHRFHQPHSRARRAKLPHFWNDVHRSARRSP